jgi:hypothetical protein
VRDSLHCDSAKAFQIQYRPSGTIIWTTVTRYYSSSDSLYVFCDTGRACVTYQWRVRNICLHNGDTLFTPYVSGPNFTLACFFTKHAYDNTDLIKTHSLSLTPNPVTSAVLITGVYTGSVHIDIVNLNGKKVFSQTARTEGGRLSLQVNTGAFDKGIYFVNISDGISTAKENFIKE